jgi:predicted ATPase/DNA-binding CsgD family transcriptional regulator
LRPQSPVADAVRVALGAPDDGDPIGAALAAIGRGPALVVLDNCEHVPDAAAVVEELLVRRDDLVLLATSREPLGVPGEQIWRIPPLDADEATALFLDRAARVRPDRDFRPDVAAIRDLVRRLDGIPLALELAAARVGMYEIPQIIVALDQRFDLLADTSRRGAERHRSLAASVDWSHELLAEPERRTLRRLAVFAGGFAIDAVTAVVADPGAGVSLGRLIDKSFVGAEDVQDGVRRYSLLETIRQYAFERLAESGELEVTRDRHLAWVQQLVRDAERLLTGRDQRAGLDVLERELPNVREAIAWAESTDRGNVALDIAARLGLFWKLHGHLIEGCALLERGLAARGDDTASAAVIWALADLSGWRGESEAAYTLARRALEVARRSDDRWIEARALWTLGNIEMQFNPFAARATSAEVIRIADENDDVWLRGVARVLHAMTWSELDHYDESLMILDEVAQIAAEHGSLQLDAWIAVNRMQAAVARGDFDDAQALYADGTRASRAIEDPSTLVLLVARYADLLRQRGEREQSDRVLDAALADARLVTAGQIVPWLEYMRARNAIDDPDRGRAAIDALRARGSDLAAAWLLLANAETTALYLESGHVAEAARCASSSIAAARAVDFSGMLADQLRYLAYAQIDEDVAAGERACLESLEIAERYGFRPRTAAALDALAVIASARANDVVAGRLLGAADTLRSRLHAARVPPDLRFAAAAERDSRQRAGDDFEDAFQEGRAMGLEDAIAYARRARGPRRRPVTGWSSLTPTEVMAAELTAQGLTNREIGERMFIAASTVKTHLAHAYAKLGVTSRAALAVEVTRRNGDSSPTAG